MKFWCASINSFKQQKTSNKKSTGLNNSLSSSASYATIASISSQKSDSGYYEISSTSQTYSCLEQFLVYERTYHENLKAFIIKYSRPLRRYLKPDEIVNLFQNIEKISTISQSIVHQCEKLLDSNNMTDLSISAIYQSRFGVMYDLYNSYISRSVKAQSMLKQCQNKISSYLHMSTEFVIQEIKDFILLPLRHICHLKDLFQHYNFTDMIQVMSFLSQQANCVLQISDNNQISILESETVPVIILQRTDEKSWITKRLEVSDSKLLLIRLDQSAVKTSICLSNVVYIEKDSSKNELRLIVASKATKYSSFKTKHVFLRFEEKNDYWNWLHYLINAVQDAKDRRWSKTNQVVI